MQDRFSVTFRRRDPIDDLPLQAHVDDVNKNRMRAMHSAPSFTEKTIIKRGPLGVAIYSEMCPFLTLFITVRTKSRRILHFEIKSTLYVGCFPAVTCESHMFSAWGNVPTCCWSLHRISVDMTLSINLNSPNCSIGVALRGSLQAQREIAKLISSKH